jgi:hypothetical protein
MDGTVANTNNILDIMDKLNNNKDNTNIYLTVPRKDAYLRNTVERLKLRLMKEKEVLTETNQKENNNIDNILKQSFYKPENKNHIDINSIFNKEIDKNKEFLHRSNIPY